ncbi:tetratricopeptide repeat protein [Parasphingopyxis algicola]|uniref:tetratricopeptide repeat protein n=1 Tax=Parasphingopyxis algicola TaxID=2026624 RepID=UPI0015A4D816|nr:tetratricopeptide repeat protein [Parasphingopyxis algicola]QLC25678.1 tetratricopeptide repeat protein [Parasphingopyxis algicola]
MIATTWLMAASAALATPQEDADALFAAQNWSEAARAYEALLETDAGNGTNWFNLAQARHSAEDHAGARTAYLRAIEAGAAPVPRIRYHLARALMSLGEREAALTELETLAATGGPPASVIRGTVEFAALAEEARFAAVVEALTPCTGPEYRAFDFWLGQWDVTAGAATQPTASSRISSKHGGCVVLEEYDAGGYTGMSINFYDVTSDRWHQSWMANNGVPVYLEGNLDETGAMVLSDADLPISTATGTINRVTWSTNEDGSVRQFWEVSTDGGETWSTAFDGRYVRREASSAE